MQLSTYNPVSGEFRSLANMSQMTERTSFLEYVRNVIVFLICAVLGFLLSNGDAICSLTSLTLEVAVNATKGFLSVLFEILILFAHFVAFI